MQQYQRSLITDDHNKHNNNENIWNTLRITKMWHRDKKWPNAVGKTALIGSLCSRLPKTFNLQKMYYQWSVRKWSTIKWDNACTLFLRGFFPHFQLESRDHFYIFKGLSEKKKKEFATEIAPTCLIKPNYYWTYNKNSANPWTRFNNSMLNTKKYTLVYLLWNITPKIKPAHCIVPPSFVKRLGQESTLRWALV